MTPALRRLRRMGWALALAACVLGAALHPVGGDDVAAAPADVRLADSSSALQTRMGLNVHIAWQEPGDRGDYVQLAADAGAGTVRDTVEWSQVEAVEGSYDWSVVDESMRLTASRGVRMLMALAYSPRWASSCPHDGRYDKCGPTDVADYARFAAAVADRYRQGGRFWAENPSLAYVPLTGVEIWNEPNYRRFWQRPDGARYAALLVAADRAVEAVDPSLMVVAGATASVATVPGASVNAIDFLRQMYAAGAGGHFDALSHHPYRFWQDMTAEQMLAFDPGSGWSQMAETSPSLRSVMVANGDGAKTIWATEAGAPTHWSGISEREQADLATQQVALWRTYPWAGQLYWYDLRDDCTWAWSTECRFGVVRANDAPKPAYEALRTAFTTP